MSLINCPVCRQVHDADRTCVKLNTDEHTLTLPEDVRQFIMRATLHLQSNRAKKPEQHDVLFHEAYRLYCKYDVEQRKLIGL